MKCSKALQKPLHYRQDNCAHRIPSPAWYRTGGLFYCALLTWGCKPETPAYLAVRTGIVLQCGDAAGLPQQRRGSAATLNPNVESVYGGLPHFFLPRIHWVIMAALITASATLSLAVGYPKKARAHADLAKAFMALEAQMVGQGVLDMTQAARFEAEILRIEMNEPRALGALVRICQNQMAAVCGKVQDIQAVPWWKWLLAHIDDFDMSAPSSTFR